MRQNLPVIVRSCAGAILTVFCLLAAYGCMSAFTRHTAPRYFELDYAFQPSTCWKPFSGAVRVWSFSASVPFDREQMVVVSPSRSVRFSSDNRWVGPAGNMLADKLMRDLSMSHVFEEAVPVGSPVFAAYEMSGHIHRFALEENGSPPHAVLDLEITLWQEKPVRTILFRKNFHFESASLPQMAPSEFAKAMSELVSRVSVELRNEICELTPGS